MTLGMSGGSAPPGQPSGEAGNWAIVGGTGAFLGARGQAEGPRVVAGSFHGGRSFLPSHKRRFASQVFPAHHRDGDARGDRHHRWAGSDTFNRFYVGQSFETCRCRRDPIAVRHRPRPCCSRTTAWCAFSFRPAGHCEFTCPGNGERETCRSACRRRLSALSGRLPSELSTTFRCGEGGGQYPFERGVDYGQASQHHSPVSSDVPTGSLPCMR